MLGLSVVTPSLNQGRFIGRTIRSVLGQGYAPLEYVVCDGGSQDETASVVSQFGDQVRWISEPDGGQATAVNKGIRATSNEVLGWLNSDDMFVPGALRTVADFLSARPEVDVVYGDARLIDAQDRPIGTYYTEPWDARRLAERCYLSQPAVFFRRSAVERCGPLDERLHYCLDYEYWLRLASGGARFAYLPTVLAEARLYPETKTLGARLAVHAEINTMLRERLGRVPDSWLLNHAHTLVELRRAGRPGGRPSAELVPYSVEVGLQAMRLSLEWNGQLSPRLVGRWLGPTVNAAWARLAHSRSAATSRPAS